MQVAPHFLIILCLSFLKVIKNLMALFQLNRDNKN
ncbi:hypothetical protein HPPC_06935 [Helicobacter pylori PeCan4]|nr:hypothetical protein HPPC_06935 [Helicobacter pylori PeCan4]